MNKPGAVAFDTQGKFAILDHTWNRVLLAWDPPKRHIAPAGSGVYFTYVPDPVFVEQVDRTGAPAAVQMATAQSDVSNVTVTSNAPSFYAPGNSTISFYAHDGRGNAATATTTVTVRDTTPPVLFNVPQPIVVKQTAVRTPAQVPLPVVVDNCECATVTSNAPVDFPVGTTTVTFTAMDAAGNRATATTTVTVIPAICYNEVDEEFDHYLPRVDPTTWVDYKLKAGRFEP